MAPLLEDVTAYLAAQCGWVAGTDLFAGDLPPAPDTLTTLYEYGGMPGMDTFTTTKPTVIRPSIQVVTRAPHYEDARVRIMAAWSALVAVQGNTAVGASTPQRIAALQDPFLFRRDQTDRVLFACNFAVWKAPE